LTYWFPYRKLLSINNALMRRWTDEMDTSHLAALITRLSHEEGYLAKATKPAEIALRTVWISQVRNEIAREEALLGISPATADMLTDDELLAELR
jgi:hypothetical protein